MMKEVDNLDWQEVGFMRIHGYIGKKVGFGVLIIFLFSVISFGTVASAKGKVKLSKTKCTIEAGQQYTLTLKNVGKSSKVKWKSGNTKIVKVKKSGKKTIVKAVRAGKTTVTAAYKGKKYKCRITVKKNTDNKEEQKEDNPVMNADSVTLYYINEDFMGYVSENREHLYSYQFEVTGTTYNVRKWSISGDKSYCFKITDSGLVTACKSPAQKDDTFTADVEALLDDGTVVKAAVSVKSEVAEVTDKIMSDFQNTYITSDMTEYQKLDKICWYINYDTHYKVAQSDAYALLIKKEGDCMASRWLVCTMARNAGLRACACGQIDDHGRALVYADGVIYLVITGYAGEPPRYYEIRECKGAELDDLVARNSIDLDWLMGKK